MIEVTVGGEPRRIGDFSAFKATLAMELVSDAQEQVETVLDAGAEFKRRFESKNYVELDRATARREFAPAVLWRDVPVKEDDGSLARDGDGVVVLSREPALGEDGQPIIGPDPLGHLTEDDWAAGNQKIRLPDSPSKEWQYAAMVPAAYKHARKEVFRLAALVLTTNEDLERWDLDETVSIDDQLETVAKQLIHRASLPEILGVAKATVQACREQLRDPFEALKAEIKESFGKPQEDPEESGEPPPAPPVAGPMSVETAPAEDDQAGATSPTSPTPSDEPTDTTTSPPPTEPATGLPSLSSGG